MASVERKPLGRTVRVISSELRNTIINKLISGIPQTTICREMNLSLYMVRKIATQYKSEVEREPNIPTETTDFDMINDIDEKNVEMS